MEDSSKRASGDLERVGKGGWHHDRGFEPELYSALLGSTVQCRVLCTVQYNIVQFSGWHWEEDPLIKK